MLEITVFQRNPVNWRRIDIVEVKHFDDDAEGTAFWKEIDESPIYFGWDTSKWLYRVVLDEDNDFEFLEIQYKGPGSSGDRATAF